MATTMSLRLSDNKLFFWPKHNICAFYDSIWFIWFNTIISQSNLSCQLWNRKLKINKKIILKIKNLCSLLGVCRTCFPWRRSPWCPLSTAPPWWASRDTRGSATSVSWGHFLHSIPKISKWEIPGSNPSKRFRGCHSYAKSRKDHAILDTFLLLWSIL